MLQHFFKPKWQSKKPLIRLKALATLDPHSEVLIQLAQTDNDSEVRLSAVQKLQHIPTLANIARKIDGVISRAAKERIAALALSPNIDEQALEQVYSLIDDDQIHRQVVADPHKTLTVRKIALKHVDEQTLLFNLAKSDRSKEIQFLAASKLDDYAQLKKLEKFTKNNKRLRQFIKQKNQAYQAKQQQLKQRQQLCDELAQLTAKIVIQSSDSIQSNQSTENQWKQDKTQLLTLQQQWKQLDAVISEKQQKIYQVAITTFEERQAQYDTKQAELIPIRAYYHNCILSLKNSLNEINAEQVTTPKKIYAVLADSLENWQEKQGSENLAKDEWQQLQNQYQAIIDELKQSAQQLQKNQAQQLQEQEKQKSKQQKQQIKKNISQIENWLDQMEQNIADEKLSKAIDLYQKIQNLLKINRIPATDYQSIKGRIQTATPTIKSARSWKHWGTDQARQQLIQAAEVLSAADDITPLKRLKQLKILRQKWQKLGKIDSSNAQKQWKVFDQFCTKAHEPCQAFYQEESSLRKKNLIQRQEICQALQQLEQDTDWNQVDWRSVSKTVYQYRRQWKQSGAVERRDWKTINQQFNDAMDALETHLSNERRINWTRRQNLVVQAERLLNELKQKTDIEAHLSDFIASAKQLQAQWQPTVTSNRNEEQALWNQFRLAIDAIFMQQRDLHQAGKNQLKQNLNNKQSLLQQLQTFLSLDGQSLLLEKANIAQIKNRFNDISQLPRGKINQKLNSDFETTITQLEHQFVLQQQREQLKQLQLFSQKVKICCRVNRGKDELERQEAQANWDRLDNLQNQKLEQQLKQCFSEKNHTTTVSTETLFEHILDIEILLKLPTPPDYQAARMQRQIEQLSEQMLKVSDSTEAQQNIALEKIQDFYLLMLNNIENHSLIEKRFSTIEDWIENSLKNTEKD